MANGYGGSGGSGGSSGSTGSGGSTGSVGYGNSMGSMGSMEEDYTNGFVKTKDGVRAPGGFHYMPNGKLMSDADHIAANGYIEKNIKNIEIDYSDIAPSGGIKDIKIHGDEGFIFSVEVYEGSRASYYNFKSKTWSSSVYKQNKIHGVTGNNVLSITFPAQSSLKTFTINVYAETAENIKTKHKGYAEFKNEDGSININKSDGSDSDIVTKILYQDVIKTLSLSCIAPSLYSSSQDTVNGTVSNSNRIIIDGDATDASKVQIGDRVTGTGILAAVHALVTKINPDGDNTHEIEISVADSIADDEVITFTPPFNGLVPHEGVSTSGVQPINVVSGSSGKYKFSLSLKDNNTGRALSIQREPTIEDLCFVSRVNFDAAPLPIPGEDITSDDYYRWPISNIANLNEGNTLDPKRNPAQGGQYITPSSVIRNYKTTKTLSVISNDNKYYTDFNEYTVPDVSINGVDPAGNIATTVDRNGRVTAKKGNLTFNAKQGALLASDTSVRIIARGAKAIKQATGMGVQLTVDKINTLQNQVSTNTSSATSASTTIPVDEARHIVVGATIRGLGINPAVANPTVVSKAASGGAINIIASSAQTLEDNTTLFFDGYYPAVTITGIIEISNMPIGDTLLYFDVERFLGCQ